MGSSSRSRSSTNASPPREPDVRGQIPILRVGQTLLATVHIDLRDAIAEAFQADVLTTIASELARNVWVHARRGNVVIEEMTDGLRFGIRVVFRDEGPGIPDIARVLKGGYSTARSMGLGLSGSKRLVDEFVLDSELGK